MRGPRWLPPALVALGAMTLVLLAAWWNRTGPRREIVLTEREAELVRGRDGSAVVIQLNEPPPEAGSRVTVDRLVALGADTGGMALPAGLAGGVRGYAVLELGGLVWRRSVEGRIREYVARVIMPDTIPERQDSMMARFRRAQEETVTRLVLLDVGTDVDALARQYDDPARFLILPAEFAVGRSLEMRPGFEVDTTGPRAPSVRIHGLSLPVGGRALRTLRTAVGEPVRYRITIATGRRYEPWVTALEVLETRAPDSLRVH